MNKRTYKFGASQLTLEFGDITTSKAQALVSSDDYYLTMGGGVSAAIRRVGGNTIVQDASKKAPARLGDVVVTTAGTLPADYIFHAITIGPGAEEMSAEAVINQTTRRCLNLLDSLNLNSIAFPAIGAGTAGFSYEDVAIQMAEVIAEHLKNCKRPIEVTIYLFDRFGQMSPIEFVQFFEEFRVRLPQVAVNETKPDYQPPPSEHNVSKQEVVPPNIEDPVVQRYSLLKNIASLGEERDRLEERLARLDSGEKNSKADEVRQRLTDVQEQRLKYLAKLQLISKEQVEVFVSYAHEDEDLRDELAKHLRILVRQGVITDWHDRKITAGSEWKGEIDNHLNTSRVILLLISANFMDSDYCYDVEMKRALERHEAKEARVIPVILRSVYWKGSPFAKLQALPKDAKPVTSWEDRDAAFANIVEGIQAALETSE